MSTPHLFQCWVAVTVALFLFWLGPHDCTTRLPPVNPQMTYAVSVLPVDFPEPAQLRLVKYCCSPSSTSQSQYATPVILEQYVRGLPGFVDDPFVADIVFVPFYPILYGLYDVFPGPMEDVAANLSSQLLPTIQRLPNSTVLVFVVGHVDGYGLVASHFLSKIRPTRPKNVVMLRTDMGDTLCACYGRPYWGDGLENIMVPYAVIQPFEFISQTARGATEVAKNVTVFFNAATSANPLARRAELVAGLKALNRTDLNVTISSTTDRPEHRQYIDGMRRSKFCLVPEGDVSTSLRLFEAIVAKCVPVIISDCMDVPFEGLEPIGDYSSFAVKMPLATNGPTIMQQLDGLMSSGEYDRMLSRLDIVWPFFIMHNGSLPQPSAVELIMQQVFVAAQRMKVGLPPLSDSQAWRRRHCPPMAPTG
jgi:hypothetical protein